MRIQERIYGLDILRASAILLVIYNHGLIFFDGFLSERRSWSMAVDGVDVFFVLSGYLIGGILIKTIEKNDSSFQNLFNFWIRRWFRTLPNYFLVLSTIIFLSYFSGAPLPDYLSEYFFFIQNLSKEHPAFFPEAWSLSVEEWFYLLIPISVFLLLQIVENKKALILQIAFFFIFASIALRLYYFLTSEINSIVIWDNVLRKQVLTRLDSLMFGVIAAYCHFYYKTFWIQNKRIFLFAGISVLLICKITYYLYPALGINNLFFCVLYFSLISIGVMLLLPWLSEWKTGKGFAFRFFTYISMISYSMYLVNLSLVQGYLIPITGYLIPLDAGLLLSILQLFFYLAFTTLISYFLYRYFEVPVMNLRDSVTSERLVNWITKKINN